MRALALALVVAAAGCADTTTVDFTLTMSPAVGALQSLTLAVSGDETFAETPLAVDKFKNGTATLRYVPRVKAGAHLHFVFHVVADTTFDIARDVTLGGGHNDVAVTLDPRAVPPDDMGGDMMMVSCNLPADCPATAPLCTNHVCTPCATAADCGTIDPSLKYCAPDGSCHVCNGGTGTCASDQTLDVCSADGTTVTPMTCPNNDCNGCTGQCGALYCQGNDVMSCNALGQMAKVSTCSWACVTGQCRDMIPTHFDRGSFSLANPADLTTAGQVVTIDTKTNGVAPTVQVGSGTAMNWATYSNGIDPANVTMVVHNVNIAAGDTVRVVGTRNLILAATGDVVINGTLDGSGHAGTNGPGGQAAASTTYSDAGRPGGGHATAGGNGGNGPMTVGLPGQAALADSDLTGAFKGGVAGATAGYGSVGAAGGAIQISSLGTITIGATGKLLANGGGGGGGSAAGNNWPGNGGGSGGSILLEAKTVTNNGVIAANGGSGGSIDTSGSPVDGVDGQASAVPAPGVMGGQCTGGKGGAGNMVLPTAGGNGPNYGCGGGGAYGRILIRVLGTPPTFGGVISPSGPDAFKTGSVTYSP